MAYSLIGKRIPCRIMGRDIGQGLITLIEKMKAKTVDMLDMKLSRHLERQVAKYESKCQDDKIQAIRDKVESIQVFISMLTENNNTISGLVQLIESMFSDTQKDILTLCTAHKSKGLEWDRVFILDRDKYMPSKFARLDWQKIQENNLIYVAITRAKLELYYIDLPEKSEQLTP